MPLPVDQGASVADRLAAWQQGDFSTDCKDFLFCEVPDDKNNPFDFGLDPNVLGFCVISQSCDIVRDPSEHFITSVVVCPLIELNSQGVSQVEKGEQPRFGMIDGAPENTVVDFTRAMSVEKELLVTWTRQRGCHTEKSLQSFARSLERFFGRFGFPDEFNESMQSLRKAVNNKYGKSGSEFGKVARSIHELRVFPHTSWDNTDDVPITIIAILEEPEVREVKEIEDIRSELSAQVKKISWVEPFRAHESALQVATLEELSAAEYLNTYPLDLNALSFAKRYNVGE